MTTILSIRSKNKVVIAGDGQVSLGDTVMKSTAHKIRKISSKGNDVIVAGFAGSTADAFTLLERLEAKLDKHPGQLKRACVELAKDWRMDRYLRKLEAMMIVASKTDTLVITGVGDVISPGSGLAAIGSGGNYALAAARAMYADDMDPEHVARKAMNIAADMCVYTNHNLVVEVIDI
ncbi:peptidase component of the HslVU protease [Candidatus Xenohaliotis californiensis]|uniref:ATP-dependent protease subunit HslV n=1 Tax=Candidatus Xenohaliotis californiensis TaxID=84677 RepID=A0ABM9N969_9RICK|nr:peptidase component of the HslVU protease [Candidatus Xenohaliotis californiensis]